MAAFEFKYESSPAIIAMLMRSVTDEERRILCEKMLEPMEPKIPFKQFHEDLLPAILFGTVEEVVE